MAVRKGRVLIIHNKDTTDEIRRRLAAITQTFKLQPPANALMILSGADPGSPRYTVLQCGATGTLEPAPEYAHIARTIDAFTPDLVIFDSLVSMAGGKLSENSNSDMDTLIRTLHGLAARCSAANLTVHHTNKSKADAAGDPTAARGASAVTGAIRAGFTLVPVPDKTYQILGLSPGNYVRLDGTGSNYGRKDNHTYVWWIGSGPIGNGRRKQ